MKTSVDNFLNLSYGAMAVFVRIANAEDPTISAVVVLGPVFTNVRNANGSLR